MKSKLPLVSVVVPCRNEERFVADFIRGIAKQSYSLDKIEIVIADGMSTDKTREIISEQRDKNKKLKIILVNNKKKITPAAFNAAIKGSHGDLILPIGAHSKLAPNYIEKCVNYLKDYPEADNVGGSINTLPSRVGLIPKSIAISLSHPFGTGNAKFRNKTKNPEWVDTVFGGCYRKKVFEKIGYYNEKLVRSQDLELNLRLLKSGGRILLVPGLEIDYYPKSSFKDIFIYHLRCGFWATYARRFTKISYKIRQYLPLAAFVLGLLFLIGSFLNLIIFYSFLLFLVFYLALSFYFSIKIALKEKITLLFFLLPIAFFLRHFGFGLGSFGGLTWYYIKGGKENE